MHERGCYLSLSNSHPADTWRLESKYQFVYIVGWDFSPTFLVVWFDNKCWTKVQHSDSIKFGSERNSRAYREGWQRTPL